MSEEFPNINERFRAMAEGMFSSVENHIGPELYQANVEHAKTMNEGMRKQVEWMEKRHSYQAALMSLSMIVLLLAAVPLLILLWRYAL